MLHRAVIVRPDQQGVVRAGMVLVVLREVIQRARCIARVVAAGREHRMSMARLSRTE